MPLNANGHTLDFPFSSTTVGYLHSHQNDYETGEFDNDGNPIENQPIKIHSPKDILSFLDIVLNANNNGIPIANVFGTVTSNGGTYTVRFTGDVTDILNSILVLRAKFNQNRYNELIYEPYFTKKYKYNKERAFLHWLKDEVGIDGINLYKIKPSGHVQPKSLKENGRVKTENCN